MDQPEDDLDNHLIYNLIVQQLRAIKQRRQVNFEGPDAMKSLSGAR